MLDHLVRGSVAAQAHAAHAAALTPLLPTVGNNMEDILDIDLFDVLFGGYTEQPTPLSSVDAADYSFGQVRLFTNLERWQCWDKRILNTAGEKRITFRLCPLDAMLYNQTQATLFMTFRVDEMEHTVDQPVEIQSDGTFIEGEKMPRFSLFKTPNMKSKNQATDVNVHMMVQMSDDERRAVNQNIITATKPEKFPEKVRTARKRLVCLTKHRSHFSPRNYNRKPHNAASPKRARLD
ncbi:hypothetical protein PROFUN_14034 [Planoprotostelium fungivorum]|uniref:Uncharacterized protein n=1 Tax=Planoprotostelium fungivorum TaxID=1890364 RepID=A0A2P6N292_9EUKA|nr:hypothetical protein PROFUN_14034 [Planoprotostelium fungivorum]